MYGESRACCCCYCCCYSQMIVISFKFPNFSNSRGRWVESSSQILTLRIHRIKKSWKLDGVRQKVVVQQKVQDQHLHPFAVSAPIEAGLTHDHRIRHNGILTLLDDGLMCPESAIIPVKMERCKCVCVLVCVDGLLKDAWMPSAAKSYPVIGCRVGFLVSLFLFLLVLLPPRNRGITPHLVFVQ